MLTVCQVPIVTHMFGPNNARPDEDDDDDGRTDAENFTYMSNGARPALLHPVKQININFLPQRRVPLKPFSSVNVNSLICFSTQLLHHLIIMFLQHSAYWYDCNSDHPLFVYRGYRVTGQGQLISHLKRKPGQTHINTFTQIRCQKVGTFGPFIFIPRSGRRTH